MRGKKRSNLPLAEKNCSFKREFLTFIDTLLLFNVRFVELIHIKGWEELGKHTETVLVSI